MSSESRESGVYFEQYQMLVRSAEEISSRRAAANNYLLSVNSLLVTIHGVGHALKPDANWTVAIPLAGVVISLSWWTLIRSYRNVNVAKFVVIHAMEESLPGQPYKDEWESMSTLHLPLSFVEQWIPLVFGFLFIWLACAAW